jgi:hypothetical protein
VERQQEVREVQVAQHREGLVEGYTQQWLPVATLHRFRHGSGRILVDYAPHLRFAVSHDGTEQANKKDIPIHAGLRSQVSDGGW